MSQETKELRVGPEENAKRVMYLAKEFLLNNDHIDIISGTSSASVVTRATEALARLNYIRYVNVRTETNVFNDKRRTRLVVRVQKTNEFAKLYQENEANRKKKEEEREQKNIITKN